MLNSIHNFHFLEDHGVGADYYVTLGKNGSGKSTLINLLCRFYDPQAGKVVIDGVDLRDMKLESLRAWELRKFEWETQPNSKTSEVRTLSPLKKIQQYWFLDLRCK